MYRGQLVESGPTASIFSHPRHRYTALLLSAIPVISEAEARLRPRWPAADPGAIAAPEGARRPFEPRCPFALDLCWRERPRLASHGEEDFAAYNPGEGPA